MMQLPEPQQRVDLVIHVEKEKVEKQEPEPQQQQSGKLGVDRETDGSFGGTTLVVVETKGDGTGIVAGLDATQVTREVTEAKAGVPVAVEDMDEELLQEQAQAVVEELQKRGACTTLALAKMLGLGKSTELNPLLFLLLEKNVLVRVTDIPPIWTLSPTFPVNPLLSSSGTAPVVQTPPLAIESSSPASAYTSVQTFQPARIMPQPPQTAQVARQPPTIITFPPIPAERTMKPIITFPPIPAETQAIHVPVPLPASVPAASAVFQQQQNADYWQSLSQISGAKSNRNGGMAPPFKKWKKQKNLSELQLRLLKELKDRGPTRTLDLSKIVGLVTCRDVNPSIYDLKQRNLVIKVNNAPPVWQLNEPGMNRAQFKLSEMELDEDEDQLERESLPGGSFGGTRLSVNPQGQSNFSVFH